MKKKMKNSAIGYLPMPNYVVLSIPKEALDLGSIQAIDAKHEKKMIDEKRGQYIGEGNSLSVVAYNVPEDFEGIELNAKVLLKATRGIEEITVDGDVYFQVGVHSVLGVLDD